MLAPPRSQAQPQQPHSGAGRALVPCPCGQCRYLGFSAHSGAEQRGRRIGQHCPVPQCCSQQRVQRGRRAQGWLGTQGQPQPGSTQPLGMVAPSAQGSGQQWNPPPQRGHLHPRLLQAQPWDRATKAGVIAHTPTIPSARLGVLSTLGGPAAPRRDLGSTHSEAASTTCSSPLSPPVFFLWPFFPPALKSFQSR